MLHGLPRNSWEWHHQISPMAEMGYRVVAHDLRGFCRGARPEGVESYHLGEYITDTLAIADELAGAGTPFHLMGTSIGSSIAWGGCCEASDAGALVGGDQYSPSVGDPGGNGGVASDVHRSGRAILVLP
ncbi:MAG: alpha/beta hydrolase [Actinomycetia bacterium]|nr:alpha/beta hydrolase [Actinomycetes bacterium]